MKIKLKQHSHKIIASMLSIFVLTIILFAGPAQAFILNLDVDDGNSEVNTGGTITFTATLDIELMDQYLPINSLMLNIGNKSCAFNLEGEIVGDNCNGINIENLSGKYGAGEGYGYGYDNSYGYGDGYNFNYGYGYGYASGTGATELVYEITIDTKYFSPGTHQAFLKALIGETTFKSKATKITINTKANEEYAKDEKVQVNENTTEIIIGEGSFKVREIVIPKTTASDKKIKIDFNSIINQESVTITNNFKLKREGTSVNYSAEISPGTIISGDGWDGTITLPTVKVPTDYSVASGNVNAVIKLGGDTEIKFSQPVKVIIGGMAGKMAGWTRGTALTQITTQCNSPINSSNIASGECYIDDGSDLVIWTYHFTEFAAYTPTTTNSDSSSSSSHSDGGCITNWECTEWGEPDADGIMSRICTKVSPGCFTMEDKPIEFLEDDSGVINLQSPTQSKNFFSRMTGAVVGALGTTGSILVTLFLATIFGAFGVVQFRRRKK